MHYWNKQMDTEKHCYLILLSLHNRLKCRCSSFSYLKIPCCELSPPLWLSVFPRRYMAALQFKMLEDHHDSSRNSQLKPIHLRRLKFRLTFAEISAKMTTPLSDEFTVRGFPFGNLTFKWFGYQKIAPLECLHIHREYIFQIWSILLPADFDPQYLKCYHAEALACRIISNGCDYHTKAKR